MSRKKNNNRNILIVLFAIAIEVFIFASYNALADKYTPNQLLIYSGAIIILAGLLLQYKGKTLLNRIIKSFK